MITSRAASASSGPIAGAPKTRKDDRLAFSPISLYSPPGRRSCITKCTNRKGVGGAPLSRRPVLGGTPTRSPKQRWATSRVGRSTLLHTVAALPRLLPTAGNSCAVQDHSSAALPAAEYCGRELVNLTRAGEGNAMGSEGAPQANRQGMVRYAALLVLLGCHHGSGQAANGDLLCVADSRAARIAIFDGDIRGDVEPLRTLVSSTMRPNMPVSVALLAAADQIAVADPREARICTYPRTASGSAEPLTTVEHQWYVGWIQAGNQPQTALETTSFVGYSRVETRLREVDIASGAVVQRHEIDYPNQGPLRGSIHAYPAALDPARE